MKLGEMLVRDGHVTPDQIQMAIERQRRDGGKLGTLLVEMGFVDLETLTMYLGLELSMPVATGAVLDRAKRTAVRLLTPEQAARLRCVPLLISERQLIVAVEDPYDVATLDEISRTTGYRVIPRVAPEIRIYYYIERYYGVPRPARFRVLGDTPRGARTPPPVEGGRGAVLPGPSLPGLPPPTDAPVRAPTPPPVLRTAPPVADASADIVDLTDEIDAIEYEADALVVELEADDAETAGAAPPTEALQAIEVARDSDDDIEPLDADAALTAVREAMQRGEIADAVLGYARTLFDAAALFIVRDNLAFGWKGFGPNVNRDRIEALLIPLASPSVLQAALDTDDRFYMGPVAPSSLHRHLFKVLRCPPPSHAAVAGIAIGSRIVNILYGHRADGRALPDDAAHALRALARAAAHAYVRLIAVSKKARRPARASSEVAADDDAGGAAEVAAADDAGGAAAGTAAADDADGVAAGDATEPTTSSGTPDAADAAAGTAPRDAATNAPLAPAARAKKRKRTPPSRARKRRKRT